MAWRLTSPLGGHLTRWSDPLSSLHQELNRLFEDAYSGAPAPAASSALRLDVKEDKDAFHVTADLPGLNERDVDVTFEDGTLTIRGEKKVERDEKKDTWHLIERSYGTFARQVTLPAPIASDRIAATFDKGVLTIVLPKQPTEQNRVKRIEIKGG